MVASGCLSYLIRNLVLSELGPELGPQGDVVHQKLPRPYTSPERVMSTLVTGAGSPLFSSGAKASRSGCHPCQYLGLNSQACMSVLKDSAFAGLVFIVKSPSIRTNSSAALITAYIQIKNWPVNPDGSVMLLAPAILRTKVSLRASNPSLGLHKAAT